MDWSQIIHTATGAAISVSVALFGGAIDARRRRKETRAARRDGVAGTLLGRLATLDSAARRGSMQAWLNCIDRERIGFLIAAEAFATLLPRRDGDSVRSMADAVMWDGEGRRKTSSPDQAASHIEALRQDVLKHAPDAVPVIPPTESVPTR